MNFLSFYAQPAKRTYALLIGYNYIMNMAVVADLMAPNMRPGHTAFFFHCHEKKSCIKLIHERYTERARFPEQEP